MNPQQTLERIVDRDTAARAGNGKLPANPAELIHCAECGEECDYGAGKYTEAVSADDHGYAILAWSTPCCEAPYIDGLGRELTGPRFDESLVAS